MSPPFRPPSLSFDELARQKKKLLETGNQLLGEHTYSSSRGDVLDESIEDISLSLDDLAEGVAKWLRDIRTLQHQARLFLRAEEE